MREARAEEVRRRYADLLAEVREVAARVRQRFEELRARFPDEGLAVLPGPADEPARHGQRFSA